MTPEAHITFTTHRDDEYFESLMAACPYVDPVGKELATNRWIASAEAAEAAARSKELTELRFLWHLDDSDALRFDSERKSYRWYRPQETSYHVDPEVIDERSVPKVVTFRGAGWNLPSYEYGMKTSYTPDELLASLLPSKYESPDAGELLHRQLLTDSDDAIELREQMDDDLLAYSLRDEDEAEVLHRWNSDPEADMTSEEKAERAEQRAEWATAQTAMLRMKLHRLLKTYFNCRDYSEKSLVTRWEQFEGRWMPVDQVPVLDWIRTRVAENGELSGYASLVRSVEYRLAKRRDRAGKNEAAWIKAA